MMLLNFYCKRGVLGWVIVELSTTFEKNLSLGYLVK